MRKIQFVTGEYYHIYNRGVDKRNVFLDNYDFVRFIRSMREFNVVNPIGSLYLREKFKKTYDVFQRHRMSERKLVEFIAYCLNSNHYHFILRQLVDSGLSEFMRKLSNGYTKYFNYKYQRSGSLFQGRFKSVYIDSNEYLLWVSVYVNDNSQIHGLVEDAKEYSWSSYPDYLGKRNGTLCNKDIILDQFKDMAEYKKFVEENIPKIKDKKELQKYLLED